MVYAYITVLCLYISLHCVCIYHYIPAFENNGTPLLFRPLFGCGFDPSVAVEELSGGDTAIDWVALVEVPQAPAGRTVNCDVTGEPNCSPPPV